MGLIDKLRRAEEQGRNAAHRRTDKARGSWDDAERRPRRKMRLHPKTKEEKEEADVPEMPASVQLPVSSTASVAGKTLLNRASEEDAA